MFLSVKGTESPMLNPKRHNTAGWHGEYLPITPLERDAEMWSTGYREGYRDGRDEEARAQVRADTINF